MTQQPRTPTTEAGRQLLDWSRHKPSEKGVVGLPGRGKQPAYWCMVDGADWPCAVARTADETAAAIEADLLAQIEKALDHVHFGATHEYANGYNNGVAAARAAIRSAAPVEPT